MIKVRMGNSNSPTSKPEAHKMIKVRMGNSNSPTSKPEDQSEAGELQ